MSGYEGLRQEVQTIRASNGDLPQEIAPWAEMLRQEKLDALFDLLRQQREQAEVGRAAKAVLYYLHGLRAHEDAVIRALEGWLRAELALDGDGREERLETALLVLELLGGEASCRVAARLSLMAGEAEGFFLRLEELSLEKKMDALEGAVIYGMPHAERALAALSELGGEAAAQALYQIAARPDLPSDLREQAGGYLGQMGEEGLACLQRLTFGDDPLAVGLGMRAVAAREDEITSEFVQDTFEILKDLEEKPLGFPYFALEAARRGNSQAEAYVEGRLRATLLAEELRLFCEGIQQAALTQFDPILLDRYARLLNLLGRSYSEQSQQVADLLGLTLACSPARETAEGLLGLLARTAKSRPLLGEAHLRTVAARWAHFGQVEILHKALKTCERRLAHAVAEETALHLLTPLRKPFFQQVFSGKAAYPFGVRVRLLGAALEVLPDAKAGDLLAAHLRELGDQDYDPTREFDLLVDLAIQREVRSLEKEVRTVGKALGKGSLRALQKTQAYLDWIGG